MNWCAKNNYSEKKRNIKALNSFNFPKNMPYQGKKRKNFLPNQSIKEEQFEEEEIEPKKGEEENENQMESILENKRIFYQINRKRHFII